MTELVVDASVALAWLLDEERDARTDGTLEVFSQAGGHVPQHWHYEVRNGLLIAVRRRRLTREDAVRRLSSLHRIPMTTDAEPDLEETLRLAFEYRLTFYDSLYLELAIRHQLSLATLDGSLSRAAQAAGVDVNTT